MEWALGWDIAGRLLVAAVLGAVIGLERELDDHPAGLRTFMTVSIGAALFGVVSAVGFDEFETVRSRTNLGIDVERVASQVVVGIGFLGAGLIFRRGDSVVNLTTAAGLWATAAVGLAAGVGDVGLAVATTAIVALVLLVVPMPKAWLLRRFGHARRRLQIVPAPGTSAQDVRAAVEQIEGASIEKWTVEKHEGVPTIRCHLTCRDHISMDDTVSLLSASDLVVDLRGS
jgi:uncharacterized membrane protein YhiD involved in acid resistance